MSGSLLVDMGNSRIKWCWLSDGQLGPVQAVAYDEGPLAESLAQAWSGMQAPAEIWLACVSGNGNTLLDWVRTNWGSKPHLVETGSCFDGLRNGYREPGRLGVDRWLGMIAARAVFPGRALCVVDLGTAVTLDIVDRDGQHLGGYILPGLSVMYHSLHERTGLRAEDDASSGFGRNTGAAITLGTRNAVLGMIERSVTQCQQDTGEIPLVVLSGGDAASLMPDLKLAAELRQELVLEGLAAVAKRGKQDSCVGS